MWFWKNTVFFILFPFPTPFFDLNIFNFMFSSCKQLLDLRLKKKQQTKPFCRFDFYLQCSFILQHDTGSSCAWSALFFTLWKSPVDVINNFILHWDSDNTYIYAFFLYNSFWREATKMCLKCLKSPIFVGWDLQHLRISACHLELPREDESTTLTVLFLDH